MGERCAGEVPDGSLNDQNSTYPEGGVVPFRMSFTELTAFTAPGSGVAATHTAVIQHDVTGGPAVTYDFLASYDAFTNANLCDGAPGSNPYCANGSPGSLPAPTDAVAWPVGSAEQLAPGFPTLTVPGAITFSALTAGQRQLRGWGTDITGITGPTYSDAITSRKADYSISLQDPNPASNPRCTAQNGQNAGQYLCTVVFAWGAHLAQSEYWDVQAGGFASGAASNPGADFHMRLQSIDGDSTGQRDRSMQSSAISAPPEMSTHVSSGQVSINGSVTDTANLEGILQAFTASDTVSFVCFSASSTPDCTTGGSQVGGAIPVTPGGQSIPPSQVRPRQLRIHHNRPGRIVSAPSSSLGTTSLTTRLLTRTRSSAARTVSVSSPGRTPPRSRRRC